MLVRRCTEPDMSGSSKASQFWDADAPFASASLVEMQKSPGLEGPLERLYEQRKVVTAYAAEHDIPTLAAYQWTLIENILRVLKPFFEMTEGASKKFEKISFVIPATSTLMSYLSKRQKDEGVQTLKEELRKAVEKRLMCTSKETAS